MTKRLLISWSETPIREDDDQGRRHHGHRTCSSDSLSLPRRVARNATPGSRTRSMSTGIGMCTSQTGNRSPPAPRCEILSPYLCFARSMPCY
jgi:hypothetical protein